MPITTRHEDYERQVEGWTKARDTIEGPRAIKEKLETYLPVPPGLHEGHLMLSNQEVLEGTGRGARSTRYQFYADFAEFPDIVGPTVEAILGLIHEKPPTVELPESMSHLIEKATPEGMTLEELWAKTTREIFSVGRFVHLAEVNEDENQWKICSYNAESLTNWRMGGPSEWILVVLEEHLQEPKDDDEFETTAVVRYRELRIDPESGRYRLRIWRQQKGGDDAFLPEIGEGTDAEGWIEPTLQGSSVEELPITVINSTSIGKDFGRVPIIPMSERALGMYRRSADYYRALYNKGDPQAVLFGVHDSEKPTEIGGGEIWCFENPAGDAKYMDIDGEGIPLMRQAIQDDFERFAHEAGRLLEVGGGPESGEALKRRLAANQVTVRSLVIHAAQGMEATLRMLGRLSGMSEDEAKAQISFTPSLDFSEPTMTGRELLEYAQSKVAGAPLSAESLHGLMKSRNVTKLTYEEEIQALSDDEGLGFGDDGEEDSTPSDPNSDPADAA